MGWLVDFEDDGILINNVKYAWNEWERVHQYFRTTAGTKSICFVIRAKSSKILLLPLNRFWHILSSLNSLSQNRWTFVPTHETRKSAE